MFNENVAKMPKTKTFLGEKFPSAQLSLLKTFFIKKLFLKLCSFFRPFISSYLIPCSEFTNFVVVRCTERASVL